VTDQKPPVELEQTSLDLYTPSGKHDLNLALRGCFVLNRKDTRRQVVKRFIIKTEDEEYEERELEIKALDRLPWFRDNEVLMAIITLACREGRSDGIEITHPHRILKLLEKKGSGKDYRDLEASIDRLAGVSFKGTFQRREGQKWYKQVSWDHLIYAADLAYVEDEATGETQGQGLRITFGETLRRDIEEFNLLTFDWQQYHQIKSDGVRALYLYMQGVRATEWAVDIFQLAETHLGLQHYDYPSHTWKKLKPILERAVKQGFLKRYEYPIIVRGKYKRVLLEKAPQRFLFEPGEVDQLLAEGETDSGDAVQSGQADDQDLKAALIKRGITPAKAKKLAAEPPADYQERLEYYDWRLGGNDPPKKPAGFLVWLMEGNPYQRPLTFKTQQQQAAEAAAEAEEKQRLQAQQKALAERRQQEATQQQEHAQERARAREKAIETYNPESELTQVWEHGVLNQMEARKSGLSQTDLADSLLLAMTDHTATIWLANEEIREQVERQYAVTIQRLLGRQSNTDWRQLRLTFVTPQASKDE
jgi:hypothetical protein